MFSGRVTRQILRLLDRLIARTSSRNKTPGHLVTGQRGEEDAYFYLRRHGYIIIARNYRSHRYRGELDLVGWHQGVLCFIEVKTRTTRDVKPAQAAVDFPKQEELRLMARDFLRHMPDTVRGEPSAYPRRPEGGSHPPEAGDQDLQRNLRPNPLPWRFDVLAVYYEPDPGQPSFELFQNAFPVAYNPRFVRSH
jgi:putative endonuclease